MSYWLYSSRRLTLTVSGIVSSSNRTFIMNYEKTLNGLRQRALFHAHQLRLIQAAQATLSGDSQGFVYEAHIQQNMPDRTAIMAGNMDLGEAVARARRLWKECNGNGNPQVEVFIHVDEIRIAIDPIDLGDGFGLDKRIADFPKQMVFADGEKMPSAWYASGPTPERVATVE
jgi:hypothetical protein